MEYHGEEGELVRLENDDWDRYGYQTKDVLGTDHEWGWMVR